jgi:hypothetical protein
MRRGIMQAPPQVGKNGGPVASYLPLLDCTCGACFVPAVTISALRRARRDRG